MHWLASWTSWTFWTGVSRMSRVIAIYASREAYTDVLVAAVIDVPASHMADKRRCRVEVPPKNRAST